jgi:hypothetical protein
MPQAISQLLARAVVVRWLPLSLLANTTRASPLTVIPGDAHKATRGLRRQLGRGIAVLGQASRVSFGTCRCPVDHPAVLLCPAGSVASQAHSPGLVWRRGEGRLVGPQGVKPAGRTVGRGHDNPYLSKCRL